MICYDERREQIIVDYCLIKINRSDSRILGCYQYQKDEWDEEYFTESK